VNAEPPALPERSPVGGGASASPAAEPVPAEEQAIEQALGEEEPAPPDLRVTKSSDAAGTLGVGDPITYTITVTNAGGTRAEDVEVHDVLPPGMQGLRPGASLKGEACLVLSSVVVGGVPQATVECGPVSLEPGESASVEIEATTDGLCGSFVNRVDVEASNEPAQLAADDHAEATDRVPDCHPGISLALTASPTEGPAGARIELAYTVANTGDTMLYGVTVVDAELGSIGPTDGFSLAPGRSRRLSAKATLRSAPMTSTATAVGADVTGRRVSAEDAVTVTVVSAGGSGDDRDAGGTAGTPFTGAGSGRLGTIALLLSVLGLVLVRLTERPKTRAG